MNILSFLFNEVLYKPLYNLLIIFYNIIPGHDLGIAIIILTVLLRLALHPLSKKAIKSQRQLQEIQPEIKALQEKYKSDPQKQAAMVMEFYREKKISPMSGCLPLLIQLPLLIALYQVFLAGLHSNGLVNLYGFVAKPEVLSPMMMGVLDLSKSNIILALVAGLAQFFQTKTLMKVNNKNKATIKKIDNKEEKSFASDFSETMNKQMLYVMPFFTVFISASLPAGLAVYWIVTSVFSILEQQLMLKNKAQAESTQK